MIAVINLERVCLVMSMETLFPGHYRKSPQDIKALWGKCAFAFDANVLLNLYRYSPTTTDSFIKVLAKMQSRIWLPWQAAKEFHDNRLEVIAKQTKTYDSTIKLANNLHEALINKREHPFIDDALLTRVSNCMQELERALKDKSDSRRKLIIDDPLLKIVTDLFHNRVGAEPAAADMQVKLDSAKQRCDHKVPPGFKDEKKDGDRKYGDVLLWFELINYTKGVGKPLVFVTDDAKGDWWYEVSGQTVGPLPQLIHEFAKETSQTVLFYRPDRFAQFASEYFNTGIRPEAVEEIRKRTEDRKLKQNNRFRFDNENADYLGDLCQHLWIHKDEARQMIELLGGNYSQRHLLQHDPEYPSDVIEAVARIVTDCRCLRKITSSLHEMSAPSYHDALSVVEDVLPHEMISLLVSLRQLPTDAINLILHSK